MTKRDTRRPALVSLAHCSLVLDGNVVLDDLTWTVRRGERWALIGANGAGKTKLLELVRGVMWPTPTGREVVTRAVERARIAYVGPERQDRYLRRDWNLKVREVVTTGLFDEDIPLTRPTRPQQARVTRLLDRFGLSGLQKRRFLGLSYGQRRLALLARALAGDPALLLMDEAFNGLDDRSRRKLERALDRVRGPAWVITTHRDDDLPRTVTHVVRLRHGRLLAAAAAVPGVKVRLPAQTRTPAPARALAAVRWPTHRKGSGARRRRSEYLLRLEGVSLYRDYRPVIRDLDWTLRHGEHWGLVGRNGSGKSTLLMLLYGDLHPALGGRIVRRGVPAGTPIERWKRHTGLVSPELQAEHFRATSVEEVVMSGRYASVGLNDAPTTADLRATRRWLREFGLEALAERRPGDVSYGQLRLALLARATIARPQLLLLDEPLTGLDADTRAAMLALLERIVRGGTQLVMAVHHLDDLAPSIRNVLRIGRGGRVSVERR